MPHWQEAEQGCLEDIMSLYWLLGINWYPPEELDQVATEREVWLSQVTWTQMDGQMDENFSSLSYILVYGYRWSRVMIRMPVYIFIMITIDLDDNE